MHALRRRGWPATDKQQRKECHVRFDNSVGVHSQSLGHCHGSAGSPQVSASRPRHPLRRRWYKFGINLVALKREGKCPCVLHKDYFKERRYGR